MRTMLAAVAVAIVFGCYESETDPECDPCESISCMRSLGFTSCISTTTPDGATSCGCQPARDAATD